MCTTWSLSLLEVSLLNLLFSGLLPLRGQIIVFEFEDGGPLLLELGLMQFDGVRKELIDPHFQERHLKNLGQVGSLVGVSNQQFRDQPPQIV